MHEGEIYKSEMSGELFEIVEAPDFGYDDDDTVEAICLSDGEYWGFYADEWRKGFTFVADSADDLADLNVRNY